MNVGQIFLEDMRFYSQMLQNPLRCMYVPIRFYAYRKNTASVSFKFNLKKLEDSFDMCDFFHECAHDESSIELRAFYNYYSVMMYKWTLETMALDGYYEMRHSIIKELRLVDLYHRVSSWVKSEHRAFSVLAEIVVTVVADDEIILVFQNRLGGFRIGRPIIAGTDVIDPAL